ncbi:phospholipase D family protein [Vibrio algivorus]|uniref:Phospholipase D-like domain-containing protein n=1 Tax=Vibrio algivorus TaxID=1667024 RepID=A0A557P9M5_9VIBR|nr:phospholipase D family protein [Vibrio algivorus]TVO37364.1 hypothetical protein FOF44_07075 [Vibrio algivorus]
MKLINQPFTGQLGNTLIELLDSSDYHTLNIAVAFAKNSGVLRMKDSFENFRARGGNINVYVGVDLGVTSYEALTALLVCTDSLNVVHTEKGQTFHSKIYHFSGEKKELIVIGSNNLTGGGLWTNLESSALITLDPTNSFDSGALRDQKDYINKLNELHNSCMPIANKGDIDRLLDNGYVFKEVSQRIHLATSAGQHKKKKHLFGKWILAHLPRLSSQHTDTNTPEIDKPISSDGDAQNHTSINSNSTWDTIWFETRKLTGGSRNILDLSMKSLLVNGTPIGTCFDLGESKFMKGAVVFFDIDAIDYGTKKDITLNFEGVDYIGNTILYPSGKNANGTWRLQIKGVSLLGGKITDAFREKGENYYLVEKIITFTKIKDDYFAISVFPESEVSHFEETSRILARNGSTRTAKRLGLF